MDKIMLCQSDYDLYNDERECSECEEQKDRYYSARKYMQEIVKQLYSGKELDLLELEGDLDELCHYFGVKLIPGDLQIERLNRRQYVA